MIDTNSWPVLALAGTFVIVATVLAWRTTTDAYTVTWARRRGVEFASAVVPQLRRHVRRTRVARTVGVTVGLASDAILLAVLGPPAANSWYSDVWQREFDPIVLAGLGYFLATVWSETAKPRDVTGAGPGLAVLAPRRLRDFADVAVVHTAWWLLGVTPVLAVLALVAPVPATPVASRFEEGTFGGALAVAAAAVFAAVLLCRRPERSMDGSALACEELTRSATVNALLGVAVGMMGAAEGAILRSAWLADWIGPWLLVPASLLLGAVSLSAWAAAGTNLVFRSRRIDALRDSAVRAASVSS